MSNPMRRAGTSASAPSSARASAAFEDILAGHSDRVRRIATELRAILFEAVPDVVEKGNRGWHGVAYHHSVAGYFCGIFPAEDQVKLGFEFGALLNDPGILTGAGSQVRYVVLRSMRDVRRGAIKKLIEEALALPPERSIKLGLLRALRDH